MTKKYYGYRSRFQVEVKNSVMYGPKEEAEKKLLGADNMAGIGIKATKLTHGAIEVLTRTGIIETAKLDHDFVKHCLERDFGTVTVAEMEGRRWRGKREIWDTIPIRG